MMILSLYLSALQLLLIVNQTPNVPVDLSNQVNSLVAITRNLYEHNNMKTDIQAETLSTPEVPVDASEVTPVGFFGVLEKQEGEVGALFGIEARIRYSDGSVKIADGITVEFDNGQSVQLNPLQNNTYDFMLDHSQTITFKFGSLSTTTEIIAK